MARRNRCLILRPGALGDVILSLAAFDLIRREHEGLNLTLASSPAGCRVGEMSGLFAATMAYESPELAALFNEEIEPDGVLAETAALVAFGARGSEDVVGRARGLGIPTAVSIDTWPEMGAGHAAEQLLARAAAALEVEPDGESLLAMQEPLAAGDFSTPEGRLVFPPPRITADVSAWWARPGPKLAIAPGSGSPDKCWPAERFALTVERLKARRGPLNVMLVLGPAEMERPDIREAFAGTECSVSECWSVPDLAALFAGCDLYLGNDSGLSHLAAWSGAEGLAVFGPTDPELWAPVGDIAPVDMKDLTPESLAESAGHILDWRGG